MDRRASDRVTANFATRCRVPATLHAATVVDLSQTGCQIRLTDAHVTPGTTVHIDLSAAEAVSGVVAWTRAQTAGVRFHRQLDTDVAAQMGIEQAPEAEREPIESTPDDRGGLQHWIRATFGLVKC